jgi:hypothetical protein
MDNSQKRAMQNIGLASASVAWRFDVLGHDADRDLIRSLARRLAEDSPDSARLLAAFNQTIAGEQPKHSSILAALRRSPLVGTDLDLSRPNEAGRKYRSSFEPNIWQDKVNAFDQIAPD